MPAPARSPRIVLAALLAATLVVVALAALPGSSQAAASRGCGTVIGVGVRVVKGNVSCTTARSLARRFGMADDCGGEMEPACVISGFHCRVALAGERRQNGIGAYCYVLKRPVPPGRDFSLYRPGRFKKAIAIIFG